MTHSFKHKNRSLKYEIINTGRPHLINGEVAHVAIRQNIKTYWGNWVTPLTWILLEKLSVAQLLNNFPTFYSTLKFIAVFTGILHWSLSWDWWIQSTQLHLFSLRSIFNITLPPTSRSFQWLLSFWLSHQIPIYLPLLSLAYKGETTHVLNLCISYK
jgi:hypothetical protein